MSSKWAKEDFVTGLSGGPLDEIIWVSLAAPSAYFLWSALQSRLDIFQNYYFFAYILDISLNCMGLLLSITLCSNHPKSLNLLFIIPGILLFLVKSPSRKVLRKHQGAGILPRKPFITAYRGGMQIITCLAILAVDFHIFPRRFAKVETWGTSLMDLGVGSFVFAAGVVAVRPLLKDTNISMARLIRVSIKQSIPLLVLGCARLVLIKGVDYHEHVTEYGVHWNFFFTLGLLPPFVTLLSGIYTLLPSYALLSLIIVSSYQFFLENRGLKAYILTAPRENLLSQNREGIFSFIGYLSIFLAGMDIGRYILPRKPELPYFLFFSKRSSERVKVFLMLALWATFWTSAYLFSTNYFALTVSRRMANLPYVLWICAYNVGYLLIYFMIEILFFKKEEDHVDCVPSVLHSINYNGLPTFLAANTLTGIINITINTLAIKTIPAFLLLTAYILTLSLLSVHMYQKQIQLKL
ncbi:GPI-anchored wall transfer protein 1 [Neolecta irregularis DAH-3]|uniref:GPI-anchored wall transfer protein n=1 Tax=Neolecta irregularis (strain DAH-3) TaxID=1198029 RepID=A0A1U7LX90_NEOID|nr:GPI-anchored wall transfer protein 1 [Neolecta irregularis DAH-3]|eukprot:OLL27141.1 GPI-anchored wall transfer protein 1 [Neolecta irregularis DAH-3]